MRCIINVAIGGRYPKEQQRLGNSLKKYFDGDFLHWSEFPNDNFNKENKYNAKASAFEEAIKMGYTQILWVDSPVVALKSLNPIFNSIEENGYLTMKNDAYNCAMSCSDACLKYFNVTRDDAEGMQEHAGGIIGVDITNPKGRKLIELFIQACKDGACDGSRDHDGQSSDPRFKFHRQCQSVLSLAANTLGLPYTMEWDVGQILLRPNKVHANTILAWTHRSGVLLSHKDNSYTRRNIKGGRRHTRSKKGGGIQYMYVKTSGGLNDSLTQLSNYTEYAKKHGYTIILEMPRYSATDLNSVFDFSNFPVPILTNHLEMQETLKGRPIEPSHIKSLKDIPEKHEFYRQQDPRTERLLSFNLNKTYSPDTVLCSFGGGGGGGDRSLNILEYIRLRPAVIDAYKANLEEYSIPEEYNSIHLRATDRKLNITNNITGMLLKDSNAIIKFPSSGNSHKDSLEKIDKFIKSSPLPVFISGDNPALHNSLMDKYPQIIQTRTINGNISCKERGTCKGVHKLLGQKDPDNLKKAIVDLLILAKAKAIMTSAGGYSRLAKKLLKRQDILDKLLT